MPIAHCIAVHGCQHRFGMLDFSSRSNDHPFAVTLDRVRLHQIRRNARDTNSDLAAAADERRKVVDVTACAWVAQAAVTTTLRSGGSALGPASE
jgi:hypothetical protein